MDPNSKLVEDFVDSIEMDEKVRHMLDFQLVYDKGNSESLLLMEEITE